MRLVLASRSPRRADLLRAAGFEFDVDPAEVDESVRPDEHAAIYVRRLALEKGRLVAGRRPADLVLAADTSVVLDDAILGKPGNEDEALRMLRALSGRCHTVVTGVAVWHGETRRVRVGLASTLVYFTHLTEEDLAWYVSSGEPGDKAGGYGIQGLASRFADRIEGSYTNVVGLPVALVTDVLRQLTPLRALEPAGLTGFRHMAGFSHRRD